MCTKIDFIDLITLLNKNLRKFIGTNIDKFPSPTLLREFLESLLLKLGINIFLEKHWIIWTTKKTLYSKNIRIPIEINYNIYVIHIEIEFSDLTELIGKITVGII